VRFVVECLDVLEAPASKKKEEGNYIGSSHLGLMRC
jgi:hypothetical protein